MKTILHLDDGWSHERIAEALFLDDSTIRDYEQQFRREGLEDLLRDNYRGGTAKLTADEARAFAQHLEQNLYATAAEACVYVQKQYGKIFTTDGMRHLLKRLGFVYKKTKLVPGKANAEAQQTFLTQYKALKEEKGEDDEILFLDGVHPQHNSKPANGWIRKGTDKEIRSNTGRKRININGALNPRNYDVVVREDERINADSTIALLRQIESYYPNAPNIYCIADNARYYRARKVTEFLASSRVKLIFLPPYSPNLNLIERLWKFLYRKKCNNRYYEKFSEFQTAIMGFFDDIHAYDSELRSLLTEKFQIIGVSET